MQRFTKRENMTPEVKGALTGGAMGIGTSIIGNIMQNQNQQSYNSMAVENSKELMDYQNAKNLEMWRDTNYSAQMKELKKAGLNESLIYAKGGAGGQLGGGMPQQQPAKAENSAGNITQSIGMGLQAQLLQAQKDNLEADARVKNTTADKMEGVDTTKVQEEINKIKADTKLSEQEKANKIQDVIKSQAETKTIDETRKPTLDKLTSETNKNEQETKRSKTLTPWEQREMEQSWKRQVTENVYLDRKERAELQLLIQDLANKKAEISQGAEKIDIEQFTREMEADYPSLFNVAGEVVDKILRGVLLMGGNDNENLKRKVNKRE